MFNLFKKKEYMNWEEYNNRIKAIDGIRFVQRTRERSVINMSGAGI